MFKKIVKNRLNLDLLNFENFWKFCKVLKRILRRFWRAKATVFKNLKKN